MKDLHCCLVHEKKSFSATLTNHIFGLAVVATLLFFLPQIVEAQTCTATYNSCKATAVSTEQDCIANAGGSVQRHACLVQYQSDGQACTADFITCNAAVSGYINPKYLVVGVTYAPPGPSSFVQYMSSSFLSNTATMQNEFKTGTGVTVSVAGKAGIPGFVSGKLTVSSSSMFTQSSTSSTSVTISQQTTMSSRLPGTPLSFRPINHDYDQIWVWLNPLELFTVNPNTPTSVAWNGYGFDAADQPDLDIYPVYVGYLNGHFGSIPQSTLNVLARSWATTQSFPSGQGPGLTASDYAAILTADPFSNPNYAFTLAANASPATTVDGRFTLSGGPQGVAQAFIYAQPAPGQQPITQTLTNVYTNSSTLGQSTTNTRQETFGVDYSFKTLPFWMSLQYDVNSTQTIGWTNTHSSSVTNSNTQTDILSITGPPCGGTTFPCVPTYTGKTEFNIYEDNIYNSFYPYPVQ